jgi:hypothetical protein
MKSIFVALFCLSVILCSVSVNIQPAYSQTNLRTVEIERMVDFLTETQYNETLGLCREAPNVAPNTYWLVSDNLWAWKALKMANQANLSNSDSASSVAEKIESSLKDYASTFSEVPRSPSGLPKSYCHEAVLGEAVLPPYRTATNYQLYNSAGYVLNVTVCDGAEMNDWQNYSDRLLVGSLSCHWQGNEDSALKYYNRAVGMWNETSQGLQDIATSEKYAVYKLALLLYTSEVLGKELPNEQVLINRLYLQQETDSQQVGFGGVITDYYTNGTRVGDTNTETTSMVLIALLTPKAEQQVSEIPWAIPLTAVLAVSAAIAVLIFKRPLKNFTSNTKR